MTIAADGTDRAMHLRHLRYLRRHLRSQTESAPRGKRSPKRRQRIVPIGLSIAMASIWLSTIPLVFAPSAQATSRPLPISRFAEQQTTARALRLLGHGSTGDSVGRLSSSTPLPGDIGTFDGTRTDSGDGGTAPSAPLNLPGGLNPPHSANTYIADSEGNRIQVVAGATGTFWGISMTVGDAYTIAGSAAGVAGDSGDGGAASSALLNFPAGVALDLSGNLYIADSGNNRVQEIPASSGSQWGISMTADDIYTVAGSSSGKPGDTGDSGPSTSALLNLPYAVTPGFDNNDIYIADAGNNRIEEMCAPGGSCRTADDIYTVAGSASGTAGRSGDGHLATASLLNLPTGLDASATGSLYIADYGNNRVQEISADTNRHWGQAMTAGHIYTVAGNASGTAGRSLNGEPATTGRLNGPVAVAVDNNDQLYIADSGNNRIAEDANSTHTEWGISMTAFDMYTVAGSSSGTEGRSGDGGRATSALMSFPDGVTMDGSLNLYISDSGNNKVREVNASSGDISTFAGNGGTLANDGNGGPAEFAGLDNPDSVATDGDGNIYIADSANNRIEEVAASTHTQWGISMTQGDVYTIAGLADGVGGWNGRENIATNAELDLPIGLAIDSSGNLYIADGLNNRIEEVPAASGIQWGISMTAAHLYTIAGSSTGAIGDSGDGAFATSALLSLPFGIAVDAAGDVYVADWANNQVREIARNSGIQWGSISMTANDIYTIAGSPTGTSGDAGDGGKATSALLDSAAGVALDSAGNLYIADSANDRIQEVAATTGSHWGQQMTANDIYTIAGSPTGVSGLAGDGGPASASFLNFPSLLAVDSSGNLYIADSFNNRIQEVAGPAGLQWSIEMTSGDIYTVAGSSVGTSGFSGDGGKATAALLDSPIGIAVDPSGSLYLTDEAHSLVREVVAISVCPC